MKDVYMLTWKRYHCVSYDGLPSVLPLHKHHTVSFSPHPRAPEFNQEQLTEVISFIKWFEIAVVPHQNTFNHFRTV